MILSMKILLTILFCMISSQSYAGWYSTGGTWAYRKAITIDHTKVSGSSPLSNFPVLISLTDANLATVANGGRVTNASGYDIIFTASDGTTKLDHEIEAYTASSGAIIFWARVSSLSNSADTILYMYYGNSSISTSQENKAGVWDSNYKGVWHFKETGTNPTVNDSTSNAGNSSVNTWTPNTSSQIGYGGQLVSGTNHIEFPDSSAFDSINTSNAVTVSMWIKWSASTEAYNNLFGRYGNAGGAAGTELLLKSNGKLAWYVNNAGNNIDGTGTNTLSTGTWYYVAAVYSTAGGKAYVNGSQDASVGYGSACGTTDNVPMQIGRDQFGTGRYFRGYFDEARVSNTARSADWILTEYRNQSSPSTFLSAGAEGGGVSSVTGITSITGISSITF